MIVTSLCRALRPSVLFLLSLPLAAQVTVPSAEYVPNTDGPPAERSVPFLTQADLVARRNYIEEEYLLTGTANLYDYVDDAGQSPLVEMVESGLPYVTRLVIRRPANPERFNGTVYVEIVNATRGFDSDISWQYSDRMIMREGAIYVGMTSKPTTVNFLRDEFGREPYVPRNFSRYESLLMTEDGQVWDMLSQTAALLKADTEKSNPLAGMGVQRAILMGYSQSAGYVKTYINSFHSGAILGDGRYAFDGYFDAAGSFASKRPNPPDSDSEFNPGLDRRNKILLPVPAPVIRFQTGTEVNTFFNSKATRQTERVSPLIRTYEMAGGAHVDGNQKAFEEQQNFDELGVVSSFPACGIPETSLRTEYVHSALLSRLDDWLESGREPPRSRLLKLVANDKGNLVLAKNKDGNSKGGARLPQLSVPIGAYSGESQEIFCILNGSFVRYSKAELNARYPTHDGYVSDVFAAVVATYEEGFLLAADGWALYEQAFKSTIGKN